VRALSYSEIISALTCQARHDFGYVGRLAGSCLKPKQIAPRLSDGRAWGAAVASWHAFSRHRTLEGAYDPGKALLAAHVAARASYEADLRDMALAGVWIDPIAEFDANERMGAIIDHYASTAEPMANMTKLEEEFDVPIRSRTGKRASTIYHLTGFIDGFVVDEHDHEWIVEFKLRDTLLPIELIRLDRQILWYAWARQQMTDRQVVGVITEQRLNEAPKPARIVQGDKKGTFRPSDARDQLTTPQLYLDLCAEFAYQPNPHTIEHLKARRWQERVPITFRPASLIQAGEELVSAAQLIRDLDRGDRFPIRNGTPYICSGCRFRKICAAPRDELYVESLFDRTEPKRLRSGEAGASSRAHSEPSARARRMDIPSDDGSEKGFPGAAPTFPDASASSHAPASPDLAVH
jgi:hypothetical protein